jgi:hypothetical protein
VKLSPVGSWWAGGFLAECGTDIVRERNSPRAVMSRQNPAK